MQALIKNLLFQIRYGFRGVPFVFPWGRARLDENLRRWNPNTEVEVQEVLHQQLRTGDVFIDVGANFGLHTILGARSVGPTGQVYAIEPVPSNIRLLKRHLTLNALRDRVSIIPMAIADKAGGFLQLHGVKKNGVTLAASLRKIDPEGFSLKVPVTTLDECLKSRAKPVRLIKIDVEGAEHLVLQGAQQILAEDHPLLLIEVHSFALPSFGSSAKALQGYLEQLGYVEQVIDVIDGVEGGYFHALYHPK